MSSLCPVHVRLTFDQKIDDLSVFQQLFRYGYVYLALYRLSNMLVDCMDEIGFDVGKLYSNYALIVLSIQALAHFQGSLNSMSSKLSIGWRMCCEGMRTYGTSFSLMPMHSVFPIPLIMRWATQTITVWRITYNLLQLCRFKIDTLTISHLAPPAYVKPNIFNSWFLYILSSSPITIDFSYPFRSISTHILSSLYRRSKITARFTQR